MEFLFFRSTAAGRGGIAVFELYGEEAEAALQLAFRGSRGLPSLGRSALGDLVDSAGEPIDEVVVTRVPGAGMWSRQDAWTVAFHGGTWIQDRAAELWSELGGRGVDRTEILAQSVAAGALDAIQASAFEALVDARTERAAEFFATQYAGGLSASLQALCESADDDVSWQRGLESLDSMLAAAPVAIRLRRPTRLLIVGQPNAGKSTLFNALAERERVVVSSLKGTTRDLVRDMISIDGFPVEIIDSAGIHERPSDAVEEAAIRRVSAEQSDFTLFLTRPPWQLGGLVQEQLDVRGRGACLVIGTCSDLVPADERPGVDAETGFDVLVSAQTSRGLDELRRLIAERFLETDQLGPSAPFTEALVSFVSEVRDLWATRSLDEARERIIMGLRSC